VADALALTFAAHVTPKWFSNGSSLRSPVAEYDRWLKARSYRSAAAIDSDYDPFREDDYNPFARMD
jgi:hypothetical protein